jgi:hypothetical protein
MATLTRLEHPVWSLITIVALALFIALFVMSVFEAPNRGL